MKKVKSFSFYPKIKFTLKNLLKNLIHDQVVSPLTGHKRVLWMTCELITDNYAEGNVWAILFTNCDDDVISFKE